ncbi:MAG: 23S rRNA (adenine(1618)-N(6))-methyltransferase RlmF [Anaerolineae bacterium]
MSTPHRSKTNQPKLNPKGLHARNLHRQGYDFPALQKSCPRLVSYVKTNAYGNLSIDFADPAAVKALNAALLKHHYNIIDWDIPEGALCPPIPGRADYIHHIAELLGRSELAPNEASARPETTLLDIGTGANGIYPLLACKIYGWKCVGSDINAQSLQNVTSIIEKNPKLKDCFTLRQQYDKNRMFAGIIQPGEFFDVSVCNPPFHASRKEALKSNQRKLNNLARNRGESAAPSSTLNFGGLEDELWCKGGERLFLKKLMKESQLFSDQCRWFTSLVSKAEHIKPAKKLLRKLDTTEIREIELVQGNKVTRILAWSFI